MPTIKENISALLKENIRVVMREIVVPEIENVIKV